MHPTRLDPEELLKQCQLTTTRRSGPGGQHRNKVETAVVLHHLPTGISAEASERRSQSENRKVALQRLRCRLAVEYRIPASDGPSPLWLSRTQNGKLHVATKHDDFAALLAEALDHLASHGWELPVVAERLQVTASQLLKLLREEPQAFALLNRERVAVGLHPLR